MKLGQHRAPKKESPLKLGQHRKAAAQPATSLALVEDPVQAKRWATENAARVLRTALVGDPILGYGRTIGLSDMRAPNGWKRPLDLAREAGWPLTDGSWLLFAQHPTEVGRYLLLLLHPNTTLEGAQASLAAVYELFAAQFPDNLLRILSVTDAKGRTYDCQIASGKPRKDSDSGAICRSSSPRR